MAGLFGEDKTIKPEKPKTLRAIIERVPYLLEAQKQKLLRDIPEELLKQKNPPISEEIIDEIFYRVLGISIKDLSPTERMTLTQVIKDFRDEPG